MADKTESPENPDDAKSVPPVGAELVNDIPDQEDNIENEVAVEIEAERKDSVTEDGGGLPIEPAQGDEHSTPVEPQGKEPGHEHHGPPPDVPDPPPPADDEGEHSKPVEPEGELPDDKSAEPDPAVDDPPRAVNDKADKQAQEKSGLSKKHRNRGSETMGGRERRDRDKTRGWDRHRRHTYESTRRPSHQPSRSHGEDKPRDAETKPTEDRYEPRRQRRHTYDGGGRPRRDTGRSQRTGTPRPVDQGPVSESVRGSRGSQHHPRQDRDDARTRTSRTSKRPDLAARKSTRGSGQRRRPPSDSPCCGCTIS